MLAKNVMVLGKLLTAAALIVSTQAQAQITVPESIWSIRNSLVRMFDGLTEHDRRKHQQAIYTALGNLDNGEVIRWYSDDSYNHGLVEIVMTQRLSGKLCRRVYSEVRTERSRKADEHWACLDESTRMWDFFK